LSQHSYIVATMLAERGLAGDAEFRHYFA